jgi:hypothetical protein
MMMAGGMPGAMPGKRWPIAAAVGCDGDLLAA